LTTTEEMVERVFDQVTSHAMASGLFERVTGHEPKSRNPATDGITCAIWVQKLTPIQSSGLDTTSARLEFKLRIYTSMLAEPQDEIDPRVVRAVSTLMGIYASHFTLGGLVREVDLLAEHGPGLDSDAGYLKQGGQEYRVVDIRLPLIVNDLWPQAA
jgi:hypothetical protein